MKKVLRIYSVVLVLAIVLTSMSITSLGKNINFISDNFNDGDMQYDGSAVLPNFYGWQMSSPNRTGKPVGAWLKYQVIDGKLNFGRANNVSSYGVNATRLFDIDDTKHDLSSGLYTISFDFGGDIHGDGAKVDVNVTALKTNGTSGDIIRINKDQYSNYKDGTSAGNDLVILQNSSNNICLIKDIVKNQMYSIKIEINMHTMTNKFYVNGKFVCEAAFYNTTSNLTNKLYSAIVALPRTVQNSSVFEDVTIDNFYAGIDVQMAGENAVLDDLNALTLSSEIVNNIVLPSKGSVNGSEIKWQSNNPAIEISNIKGYENKYQAIVKKSFTNDIPVTMTATLTLGDVSLTKDINVIVKKDNSNDLDKNYILKDDFSGEYLNPTNEELYHGITDPNACNLLGWKFNPVNPRANGSVYTKIETETDNNFITVGRAVNDDHSRIIRRFIVENEKMATIDFDINFDLFEKYNEVTGKWGYATTTFDVYSDYEAYQKGDSSKRPIRLSTKVEDNTFVLPGAEFPIIIDNIQKNTWYNIKIEINYVTHKYNIYTNGNLIIKDMYYNGNRTDGFEYGFFRSNTDIPADTETKKYEKYLDGEISIDNFSVYSATENKLSQVDVHNLTFDKISKEDINAVKDYLSLPLFGDITKKEIFWEPLGDILTIKVFNGKKYGIFDKSKILGESAKVRLFAVIDGFEKEFTMTVLKETQTQYILDDVNLNNNLNITFPVCALNNNSNDTVVIAMYDQNGKLVDIYLENILSLEYGNIKEINYNYSKKDYNVVKSVKVFMYDDINTLKPVTKAYSGEFNSNVQVLKDVQNAKDFF